MKEIAEFLFAKRAPNLPPEGLAEIFDRLIWCLDDINGPELLKIRDQWLLEADVEKVRIALAMTDAYPRNSREELVELFRTLTSRWPELLEECEAILARWDTQYEQ